MWEGVSAAAAVAEEALSPHAATQWRLHAVDAAHVPSYSHRVFALQAPSCRHCFICPLCAPSAACALHLSSSLRIVCTGPAVKLHAPFKEYGR